MIHFNVELPTSAVQIALLQVTTITYSLVEYFLFEILKIFQMLNIKESKAINEMQKMQLPCQELLFT